MTENIEDRISDETSEGTQQEGTPVDNPDETVDNNKVAKANKEAAKYRNQLRDTEAELDRLKAEFQQEREFLMGTLAAEQWRILDAENRSSHSHGGPNYHLTNEQLQKMGVELDQFMDDTGRVNISQYRQVVSNLEKQLNLRSEVVGSAGTGTETPERNNDFARKLAGDQYQD
jgi:hypothetical protein